jgi:putative spermidine/putrescine transport system permease protein
MRTITRFLLFVAYTLPFLYLLTASVALEWRFPDLLPGVWSGAYWQELFHQHHWWSALGTSTGLALAVAVSGATMGLGCARGLSRHPRGHAWIRWCYLPYGFSPVIYACCMQFFYHRSGLAGHWAGVYLAQTILVFPLAVLLLFPYFDEKLKGMEDVSATLGASAWQITRRVLWPMLQGPVRLVFFQLFLISWFDYGICQVIGLGQVRSLTLLVFQYIGEANLAWAALASCIIGVPPLLLWAWQHRLLRHQEGLF